MSTDSQTSSPYAVASSLHGKKYAKLNKGQILHYNRILAELAKDPLAKGETITKRLNLGGKPHFSEVAAARETLGVCSGHGLQSGYIGDRLAYEVVCHALGVEPVKEDRLPPKTKFAKAATATLVSTPVAVTTQGEAPEATIERDSSKLDKYKDIIGTLPDSEVAKRSGMTSEAVRLYRRQHNIPGILGHAPKPAPVKAPAPVTTPIPSFVPVPAPVLASVVEKTVAPKKPRSVQRGASEEMKNKISGYAYLFGKVGDRKIADLAGVSQESVRRYRISQAAAGNSVIVPSPVLTPVVSPTREDFFGPEKGFGPKGYRCMDCARPLSGAADETTLRCSLCFDKQYAIEQAVENGNAEVSAVRAELEVVKAKLASTVVKTAPSTTQTALVLLLEAMRAEGVESVSLTDKGVVSITQRVVTTSSFVLEE